jgi:glycosyltransferase involved in cell wall biosynthesis
VQDPNHQPRVAFLGYAHDARGGIAQFGRELAERVGERAAVRLVGFRKLYPRFTRPGRQGPDPSLRSTSAVTGESIPVPWLPWTWKATADHVMAFSPDLLVVQWWSPFFGPCVRSVVRRARRGGTRTLIICHNHRPHETVPFWRALTRATLAQADEVAAFTPAVADGVRAIVPGAQVHVAGSLPPLLQLPDDGSCDWQQRLRLSGGPVILFFGNVRAYKGLEDLLAALPLVRRKVDATLVVAGSFFEPLERFERQASESGVASHVRFVPEYIPDEHVPALFAASDVVVMPYRAATQSGLVGQAAVARKPVVATAVGAFPEVIGANGILVPPRDPQALARGLVEALHNPPPPPELQTGEWDRWRDFVLEHAHRRQASRP